MNEFNSLKDLELKFEDVSIYIHELNISLVRDFDNNLSGYTNVWEGITPHYKHDGCEFVGNVHILFRNQGNDFSSCLMTFYVLSASSDIDKSHRSVFAKTIQCLFEWMKKYCDENLVMDSSGNLFVLPEFGFPKDVFRGIPDEQHS